ncbi:MAG: PaaI family thioesterase [Rubricoccaceae bacterium]|nr:PaaI family thioesterase [Rubricoccaceae bacterium]
MPRDPHYAALERMYLAAPVNRIYKPTIAVSEGAATVEIEAGEGLYHSAGAVHGSAYFKMLDDAAFFAANSLEREVFVLTSSFTTYLLRPVTAGTLRSEGRVVHRSRTQFLAEAVLVDADGRTVGRGNGLFVRGRLPLTEAVGYADGEDGG